MRLYVIGGEGQVARSLREAAALDKNIVFGYGARPEVDLLHPSSIEKAIADFRPDVVINPAAYTAVDKAESEPDQAFALNRDGARAAAASGGAAGRAGYPSLNGLCVRREETGRVHRERSGCSPRRLWPIQA